MERICIVGAGAVGGFIGTRLAVAGETRVSAFARGATLEALRTKGWRLQTAAGLDQVPAVASDRAEDLGPQDIVVIAVKGPALTAVVRAIGPLLGPSTMVVPAMNGVPWWFCDRVPGFPGGPLESVDPGGDVARTLPIERVVGCVVHGSIATPEPGLVAHKMGNGLIVGEAVGGQSPRAQRLTDLLSRAGFDATHSPDVRRDIWYKLWGNMTMNPVTAITGATGDRVLADPLVRAFCQRAMEEAKAIGAKIGCPIDETPEDRHRVTAKLGAFRTSMLQDAQAGRPLEIDSLVGVVREIGGRLGIATPDIDAIYGLARLFGRMHGLYPKES